MRNCIFFGLLFLFIPMSEVHYNVCFVSHCDIYHGFFRQPHVSNTNQLHELEPFFLLSLRMLYIFQAPKPSDDFKLTRSQLDHRWFHYVYRKHSGIYHLQLSWTVVLWSHRWAKHLCQFSFRVTVFYTTLASFLRHVKSLENALCLKRRVCKLLLIIKTNVKLCRPEGV